MVLRRCSWVVLVAAGLLASSAAVARQNIVSNGSLELGPGQGGLNPFVAADWTEFIQPDQNVEPSDEANRTGGTPAPAKESTCLRIASKMTFLPDP